MKKLTAVVMLSAFPLVAMAAENKVVYCTTLSQAYRTATVFRDMQMTPQEAYERVKQAYGVYLKAAELKHGVNLIYFNPDFKFVPPETVGQSVFTVCNAPVNNFTPVQ